MTSVLSDAAANNYLELDGDPIDVTQDWTIGGWFKINYNDEQTTAWFIGDNIDFTDYIGLFGDVSDKNYLILYMQDDVSFDYVNVGIFNQWIFTAITHIGGTNNYTVYWRGEDIGSLNSKVLSIGSEFNWTSFINVLGDSVQYGDCAGRAFFAYDSVLNESQLMAQSATFDVPVDSPIIYLALDDDTTATVNLGTGSNFSEIGTFTTAGDEPNLNYNPLAPSYRDSSAVRVLFSGTIDTSTPLIKNGDKFFLWVNIVNTYDTAVITPPDPSGWAESWTLLGTFAGLSGSGLYLWVTTITDYLSAPTTTTVTSTDNFITDLLVFSIKHCADLQETAFDDTFSFEVNFESVTAIKDNSLLIGTATIPNGGPLNDPDNMIARVNDQLLTACYVWTENVNTGFISDKTVDFAGGQWFSANILINPFEGISVCWLYM